MITACLTPDVPGSTCELSPGKPARDYSMIFPDRDHATRRVSHSRCVREIPSPHNTGPGIPGKTSSTVAWACSNAPAGWHTGSAQETGPSGNHGQPEGMMQVFSHRLYLGTA